MPTDQIFYGTNREKVSISHGDISPGFVTNQLSHMLHVRKYVRHFTSFVVMKSLSISHTESFVKSNIT